MSPSEIPSICLACEGYFGLMSRKVSYVFDINVQAKAFTGSRDSLHDVEGIVGEKGDLIVLIFKDATGMNYAASIDRNSGSFKVDLSNDKLSLANNISGSCSKFSGRNLNFRGAGLNDRRDDMFRRQFELSVLISNSGVSKRESPVQLR